MTLGNDAEIDERVSKAEARRRLDEIETPALREAVNWFVLLAGTSNVIMQLSMQPVGYGVMQSKVDDGNLFLNPKRRSRTTLSYIAVTMLGGGEERAAMRKATNRSHAQVRSDAGNPVTYNAFDPALQKWVAACMHLGAEYAYEQVHGPLEGEFREQFYREGRVFGTTLQLPDEEWPATRDAFQEYWDATLDALVMDEPVRTYLTRVVNLEYLGRKLPERVLRWRRRMVAGYLDPRFRELMQLPWTADDQLRFDRFNRRMARFMKISPRALREYPIARQLKDVRKRLAAGQSLF